MDAKIKMGVMPMKSKEGEKLKQLTILIVVSFGMMVGFLISIPFVGLDVANITGSVFCFLLVIINIIRWLRLFYELCCR